MKPLTIIAISTVIAGTFFALCLFSIQDTAATQEKTRREHLFYVNNLLTNQVLLQRGIMTLQAQLQSQQAQVSNLTKVSAGLCDAYFRITTNPVFNPGIYSNTVSKTNIAKKP